MSKNKSSISPAYLMAGMAMGVDFLSQFQKRIVANGGSPLLLHHMSLPGNAKMLDALAKIAIAQHFRVPRTELERRAAEASRAQFGDGHVESDKRFFWSILHLDKEYGIPCRTFGEDGTDEPMPIPKELREQIEDRPLVYPMIVNFEGELHVVVCLLDMTSPQVGDVINDLMGITVAPTKYFDLEH